MLSLFLQQPVLDQPRGAAVPRIVCADAKVGLLDGDRSAGPCVAKLEGDSVIGAGDAGHNPDKRLIRVEFASDCGIATVALA